MANSSRPAEHADRDLASEYLLQRVNYERTARFSYSPDTFKLSRMVELLDRLGSPHRGLPVVHVAGTKGKGSTATMIAAMLKDSGYRTGLFTSPHFEHIEERFVVDEKPCSGSELAELVERIKPVVAAMDRHNEGQGRAEADGPTYFEIVTAIALEHFRRQAVDVAILEVGLGGRLDATNVAETAVSVITSISFDHMAQLGNTLESIASEKAGIIKPGVPVVCGVKQTAPREVIRQQANGQQAPLLEIGTDFEGIESHDIEEGSDSLYPSFDYFEKKNRRFAGLRLAMPGHHQIDNAAVAVATVEQLHQDGWKVPDESIRSGLARAVCPARIEIIHSQPAVIFDVAHNRASLDALVNTLNEQFTGRRRWAIFAAAQDKDLDGMLEVLVKGFDQIIFTRFLDNPRAMDPAELARMAESQTGKSYPVGETPDKSWDWIISRARPNDLICVTGSFFLVSQLRNRPNSPLS